MAEKGRESDSGIRRAGGEGVQGAGREENGRGLSLGGVEAESESGATLLATLPDCSAD